MEKKYFEAKMITDFDIWMPKILKVAQLVCVVTVTCYYAG